jgi:UDP-glucose 4-epimerase
MRVLVTGGAGFIGSHTCLELLNADHEVVVVDNLANGHREALRRVESLAGRALSFQQADLTDRTALAALFGQHAFDAVIHFAGLKAVGESVAEPLRYYQTNVSGTLNLIEQMARHGVFKLVFSSSATVYGEAQRTPIDEEHPLAPRNPYGRTKLVCEELLRDLGRADERWRCMLLRYFNPVGAHASGRIGEDPSGPPSNLLPYIAQVAVGRLPELRVYGVDYPTPDGTGIRDYIHVVDVAVGHLRALEQLERQPGVVAYNLGTGRGHSVFEVIAAFERVSGRRVPYRAVERRPGDSAVSYADPARAARELGWAAERDLEAMCADAWRWQAANPQGFPLRGER